MNIKIDKIVRSRRRTIALEIFPDTTIIVRAPKRASRKDIERFVFQKKGWINNKIKLVTKRAQENLPKRFISGEGFLYLGKTYPLALAEEQDIPLAFDQEFKLLKAEQPQAKEHFIKWYKQTADRLINERLRSYAALAGLKYNKYSLSRSQRLWGSCNFKGDMFFNWRLIMAPLAVLDYVVVHELAHLQEKNHSGSFWAKVKILHPNYKESRNWLKCNGHLLRI